SPPAAPSPLSLHDALPISPDEERGHIVKAYVVLRPGQSGDAAMTRLLQEHVKSTIAPYKYPRAIEFVQKLPRTETGKLQRFELRSEEHTSELQSPDHLV